MAKHDAMHDERIAADVHGTSPDTGDETRERRIDPPHRVSPVSEESGSGASIAAAEPASTVLNLGQLRLHATQLATHLDSVREELDRRDAELCARVAQSENQMRGARLWLQQRDEEHAARTADLDAREQEVKHDESRLMAERKLLVEKASDLERREAELADAQDALERRANALETSLVELNWQRQDFFAGIHRQQQRIELMRLASQELVQQMLRGLERRRVALDEEHQRRLAAARLVAQEAYQDELQRATAELAGRERLLTDAEALLAEAQRDLIEAHQQLADSRARHQNQARVEREGLARRERELNDEWQRRQQALEARSDQLDLRAAALEETRREVARTHREALELRLATEELWARLSEVAPAAGLEQSLAKIRQRISETYQWEQAAAEDKLRQIEELHARLAEQYARLAAEKAELRTWVENRQQDIVHQATRLHAREQQLESLEDEASRDREVWDEERRTYQAEIRRLRDELRRETVPA